MSFNQQKLRSLGMHYRLFGIRGALARVMYEAGLHGRHFRARVPASTKTVHLRLGTSDVAAFEQVMVDQEYGFALPFPPRVIVDAGANIGLSAVTFSMLYPDAKIFAIEADRENYEILCLNAAMYPAITPIHAALWHEDTQLSVVDAGTGAWGMQVSPQAAKSGTTSNAVRAISLGTLCKDFKLTRVDLLKVDIEGAEWEVFGTVADWIDRVQTICAELHDRFKPGCTARFTAATKDFVHRSRRGELVIVSRQPG
jgi:FkbM family methyltransferase